MVYDFSILSWYELGGVDVAQVRRDPFFRKAGEEVKYIFTDEPHQLYIERYEKLGLDRGQMLCAQVYMTGKTDLSGELFASDWIADYTKLHQGVTVIRDEKSIDIRVNGRRVLTMMLREDGETFYSISYYESERLIAQEIYADRLLWTHHYVTVQGENGAYAKNTRTVYVDERGQTCFELLPGEIEDVAENMRVGLSADSRDFERYLFPEGEVLSKTEFLQRFLEKLHITVEDVLFIDRPMRLSFVQPLFQLKPKAPVYIFLHSGHYFLPGEDPDAVFWNKEYYYYFRHADQVRGFIVSTKEQKLDLKERLREEGLHCPEIYVIPASGVQALEYPEHPRKPYSLMTASRLNPRKKIDVMLQAVIKAHETIPEVTLDLYGKGDEWYMESLRRIVEEAGAGEYIHFMGRQIMTGKYTQYEVYLTGTKWETLGLSMMEAVAAGQALIGWDVRYGNAIFIRNGKNGIRIPTTLEELDSEDSRDFCVQKLSDAIIEIFRDRKRLKRFGKKSYEIAEEYLDKKIGEKWVEFAKKIHR